AGLGSLASTGSSLGPLSTPPFGPLELAPPAKGLTRRGDTSGRSLGGVELLRPEPVVPRSRKVMRLRLCAVTQWGSLSDGATSSLVQPFANPPRKPLLVSTQFHSAPPRDAVPFSPRLTRP